MKGNFRRIFLLILLIFLFFSTSSFAGLLETLGLGSKATSLGGAFAAYADDPFAVHYNPAGLTQINRMTISNGVHTAFPVIKISNFLVDDEIGKWVEQGNEFDLPHDQLFSNYFDFKNAAKVVPAPHLAVATPLSKKLFFGFGFYSPFGAEAHWNPDPILNPGAFNATYGKCVRIAATPTLAYKVNKHLSIGAGIGLGMTEVKSERIVYLHPKIRERLQRNKNAFENANDYGYMYRKTSAVLDSVNRKAVAELMDLFNYSFNVGLMFKPNEKVTFGVTYRSRTRVELEGELEIEGIGTYEGIPTITDAETTFDNPAQWQFGVRCQPTENFSIELDYVWTNWDIIDTMAVYFNPELLDSKSDDISDKYLKNTNQLKFGFEWIADDKLTIRGGYFYDPSPVPDDTFDMASTDVDKSVYTLGVGVKCPELSKGRLHPLLQGDITIDGVFQFITSYEERQVGQIGEGSESLNKSYNFEYEEDLGLESYGTQVSLNAEMHIWAVGFTLNYMF